VASMSDGVRSRDPLLRRVSRRFALEVQDAVDKTRGSVISALDRWPCTDRKYLIVGSESSGTTALADLLFVGIPGIRFFREGRRQAWVWEAYKRIHQGKASIRDYPRLQLFDAIKVPGFAMIIEQFRAGFTDTRVIYVVRDPRDFVGSAFRTWRAQGVDDPARIPWVYEDWLEIPNSDPVERLCMRWKAYLRSGSNAQDVVFIRYEDFYADKLLVIHDLAGLLGLPFNEERVAARKDEQISRARHYIPRGPGGWSDDLTPEQVQTIERLCADEMRTWNYLDRPPGG